ncbi:MFS transporter [Streptomyces sp. NPDC051776]|uniref:MFS transporter n=1 Tax=Streptomyces sp. NPDC051776 TaxID=3155414 RepID=UPI00344117EB
MGAMIVARAIIGIDALAVLVALPAMQREFDASPTDLQWFVNAFLLTYAGLVALGGRAGDAVGHLLVLRVGMLLFVAASAAGGLAQSTGWLIASRAAQGAGAALIRPNSETILASQFGQQERGRAVGISGSASTLFMGMAPLIGGLLITTFSWRAIFYINLPLGLACLALARMLLPAGKMRHRPVPWGSAPLIMLGLGGLVFAVMTSREWGWLSPTFISLLAASALILVTVIKRESRLADPLIQVRLFALRNFSADAGLLTAIQFSVLGFQVFFVIWMQDVLGFSAIKSGLFALPIILPVLLCAPLGGALYDRVGSRMPVGAGGMLLAGGLLCAAVTLHYESYSWLVGSSLAVGTGIGILIAPLFTDAFNVTPPELRGQAQGVLETTRGMGAALGLAVMGAVVTHVQGSSLSAVLQRDGRIPISHLHEVERSIGKAVTIQNQAKLPAGIPADLLPELKESVTLAVSASLYLGFGVVFLATLVATLLLPRKVPGGEFGTR